MRALTANDVAGELGRTLQWLYDNWQSLVAQKGMPAPLNEGGALVWSAAQFYAWLDRDLPKDIRAHAACIRAAFEAYEQAPTSEHELSLEDWRRRLAARFTEEEVS